MVLVRETCEYRTVEGRSIWCSFGVTCGYHSRLEGYSVCPGEACLCQLLTDNLLTVIRFSYRILGWGGGGGGNRMVAGW